MNAINLNFKLHPAALITMIESQAHGISKALTELIMNSMDAGATEVIVNYHKSNKNGYDRIDFKVVDDGKGFTKKNIMDFFRTFGTPHEDDDAYFGRFRLGRVGQVFTYAITHWHSKKYKMDVDIYEPLRDKAVDKLAFKLYNTPNVIDGCEITGHVYSNLVDDYELQPDQVRTDLAALVKYFPIPVILNGEQINTGMQQQKPTFEDEYAYYFLDKTKTRLKIYNLGVLVDNADIRGVIAAGNIVSKKALRLSTSRESIIEDRCEVWQNIVSNLKTKYEFNYLVESEAKLKDIEAYTMVLNMVKLKVQYPPELLDRMLHTPTLTALHGEALSFAELAKYRSVMTVDLEYQDIHKVERFQRNYPKALALDCSSSFNYFSWELYNYFKEQTEYDPQNSIDTHKLAIDAIAEVLRQTGHDVSELVYYDFYDIQESLADPRTTIEAGQYTQQQSWLLETLAHFNPLVLAHANMQHAQREIRLGTSEQSRAWTDGEKYITFNVNCFGLLDSGKTAELMFILIHEYSHNDDSQNGHSHTFYENFHDIVIKHDFTDLALDMRQYYAELVRKGSACLRIKE